MRHAGNPAVVLDPYEQLATIGIRKSDQALPNIPADCFRITRGLCGGRPRRRALELTEVALAESKRCSYVKVGLVFRVWKTTRTRRRLRQRIASRRLLPSAFLRSR